MELKEVYCLNYLQILMPVSLFLMITKHKKRCNYKSMKGFFCRVFNDTNKKHIQLIRNKEFRLRQAIKESG